MPSPLLLIRHRHQRRTSLSRRLDHQARRLALGGIFLLVACLAGATLVLALAYADTVHDLPSIEQLPLLLNPSDGSLLEPTRLYDRTGQHLLLTLAPENARRPYLPYNQIPSVLVNAVIAVADPQFWEHNGYTLNGWRDPLLHPTLAQQLAADLLLWNEPPSVRRAIRERILAAQITARYGRAQVLEWYLNSAYFGNQAWGVESAARLYLGKSASQVNVSEAALLAALTRAPALNPFDAPQAAENERVQVLQTMALLGMVDPAAALTPPPVYAAPPAAVSDGETLAPAFLNLTLAQLNQRFAQERVARGGVNVFTTLDYALQQQAVCTLQTLLQQATGNHQEIRAHDGSPCLAARFLPSLPPGFSAPRVTASALILDPRAGQVLAIVGDSSHDNTGDYLLAHPAGTLLTPFLYLTAFTRGFGPASLAWDIPGEVANFDGNYHGPVRLRLALVNDYLPPAAVLLEQMGLPEVQRVATSFGLEFSPAADFFSDTIFLSPYQIASAYAVFANQGMSTGQRLTGEAVTPVLVWRILGVDHAIWADWSTPDSRPVVSPPLAYLVNHVLSDDSARRMPATLTNAFALGRPLAVKVGRPFQTNGIWIVGYTPQRLIVVWVETQGEAQPSASGETDAALTLGAGLWRALMQYALQDLPAESWAAPAGIVQREVCDPSGMLPSPACPNVVPEIFLSGNEPQQEDTLYQALAINRESGLLATVFTPPELVEERVYLMIPPQARAWAEAAGIPAPPTAYDTITLPPVNPDVHITSPTLFADGRGTIPIVGSATGDDFAFYRLEYGSGLNPARWIRIGNDVSTPVREGLLAEWDTRDLNGLYILRLLVAHVDGRLEQATVALLLDNTPPQVTLLSPASGATVTLAEGEAMLLRAEVNDSGLAKVSFYMDGNLLAELTEAPFEVLWAGTPGRHSLHLVATDRAGNVTSVRAAFQVRR